MKNIFLSASVPLSNREYFDTANPFLIQFAVREFLTACLGRYRVVWGGHPAITPMVWAVCEDLGVEYAQSVTLYQSTLFEESFPEENKRFGNVNYVDSVDNDRSKSLYKMRLEMLSLDYEAAVFIGGMKGIFDEYNLFKELHPNVKVLPVYSPGGAAMQLAIDLKQPIDRIDYANMFYEFLGIEGTEPRLVKKHKNRI
jgi:hypothetical protein